MTTVLIVGGGVIAGCSSDMPALRLKIRGRVGRVEWRCWAAPWVLQQRLSIEKLRTINPKHHEPGKR